MWHQKFTIMETKLDKPSELPSSPLSEAMKGEEEKDSKETKKIPGWLINTRKKNAELSRNRKVFNETAEEVAKIVGKYNEIQHQISSGFKTGLHLNTIDIKYEIAKDEQEKKEKTEQDWLESMRESGSSNYQHQYTYLPQSANVASILSYTVDKPLQQCWNMETYGGGPLCYPSSSYGYGNGAHDGFVYGGSVLEVYAPAPQDVTRWNYTTAAYF